MYQLVCELNGVEQVYISESLEKLRNIFLDLISYEKIGNAIFVPMFFNNFSLCKIEEIDVRTFLDKEVKQNETL